MRSKGSWIYVLVLPLAIVAFPAACQQNPVTGNDTSATAIWLDLCFRPAGIC